MKVSKILLKNSLKKNLIFTKKSNNFSTVGLLESLAPEKVSKNLIIIVYLYSNIIQKENLCNRIINREYESFNNDVTERGFANVISEIKALKSNLAHDKSNLINRILILKSNELLEYLSIKERSLEDHEYKNDINEENIYRIYQLSTLNFKNRLNYPINEKNSDERIIYNYKVNVS